MRTQFGQLQHMTIMARQLNGSYVGMVRNYNYEVQKIEVEYNRLQKTTESHDLAGGSDSNNPFASPGLNRIEVDFFTPTSS